MTLSQQFNSHFNFFDCEVIILANFKLQQFYKQTGGSTLLIAGILLFSTTLVTLYGAQVGVLEQRISGNYYQAKQAELSTSSGLTAAIINLDKPTIIGADTGTLPTGTLNQVGSYDISYRTITAGNPNELEVIVTGKSADNSAQYKALQQYTFSPFLRETLATSTLISKGDVTIADNVSLDNKSLVDDTVLISGGIFNKMTLAVGRHCPKTSRQNLNLGLTNKRMRTRDPKVSKKASNPTIDLTNDAYFELFFANTKQNIRKFSQVIDCSLGCTDTNIETLSGLVWIDGNLNLNAGKSVGKYTKDYTTSPPTTTTMNPIMLIVNGDFKMSHNSSLVHGLVYVMGSWTNNVSKAKGKVRGSVIVEGVTNLAGSTGTAPDFELKYHEEIMNHLKTQVGSYLPVAGTWRDFDIPQS